MEATIIRKINHEIYGEMNIPMIWIRVTKNTRCLTAYQMKRLEKETISFKYQGYENLYVIVKGVEFKLNPNGTFN